MAADKGISTSDKVLQETVKQDPWQSLKSLTQARIGLGRTGVSTPTKAQLRFNLDHALARDAVNIPLNMNLLLESLELQNIQTVRLHSRAAVRREYLQRPDPGRRLNADSVARLESIAHSQPKGTDSKGPDVSLVLVDGLSSTGVQQQGALLCQTIIQDCEAAGFSTSPVCLVEQGRVAIGDEVGEVLNAKACILVVGERPGLSSPDSLGIYFTYHPKVGLNDASRNCISNIRPGGLTIKDASGKVLWLLQESYRLGLSGVNLKDTTGNDDVLSGHGKHRNFLLPINALDKPA